MRTALTGWLAGAQVMLLDLNLAGLDRWGWLDRWAWDSLFSVALVEEGEADRLAADPRGLARERIGLWAPVAPGVAEDAAHPDVEVLERACERALARHRGGAARPGVFLDRDGTLVRETGYLSDPEAVELLPGVGRALRNLVEAGVPLVVVSNQSGVGRGMFTAADVHAVMARLRRRLRVHGVEISAIYFCPHRPEEGCPCRKPRSGLLERAAEDLHLSLAGSVMIGDKRIDAAAGRIAGGRGVLVRTGYGREEELRTDAAGPAPDQACDDLGAAVAWWLGPE
jgi:histidinol-phosphate phosphatase family protein